MPHILQTILVGGGAVVVLICCYTVALNLLRGGAADTDHRPKRLRPPMS